MRPFQRVKRIPYIIWLNRHNLIHILIGVAYAWFLRELWGEFSPKYLLLSIIGSEIIDMDHLFYLFLYGRHDQYSLIARSFLKQGQIGTFMKYLHDTHKNNTSLMTHNIYFIIFFAAISIGAFFFDRRSSVAFFGAIVLHLLYDIYDDLWVLGRVNENWKRLRRKKPSTLV